MKKEYVAIFAVGAKMLASFRSVMQQAQLRMAALAKSAKATTGMFKKLGGVMVGLIGLVGGFSLSKFFKGSVEAASREVDLLQEMQVLLLKNNAVRAQGHGDMRKALEFAGKQRDLIVSHNEQLAKQGVLTVDVYNALSKSLLKAGIPTKDVMHSVGAMGDLLVAIKGVNASEQDAADLAEAMNKAIYRGQGRGLQQFGIFIDKDWAKRFPYYFQRLQDLQKRMAFAQGEAARRAAEPLGRIKILRKELEHLGKQVGYELLPVLGRMADQWRDALPALEPNLIASVHKLGAAFEWVNNMVANFFKGLATQAKKEDIGFTFSAVIAGFKDIKDAIFNTDKANKNLSKSFGETFSTWFNEELKADAKLLESIAQSIQTIKDLMAGKISGDVLTQAAKQTITESGLYKGIDYLAKPGALNYPAKIGQTAAAQAATAPAQNAFKQIPLSPEGLKAVQAERASVIADLQRPEIRNLVSATIGTEQSGLEDQKNVLEALVNRAVVTHKPIEQLIKGGFYGPYNVGKTQAVMAKGLTDARSKQVAQMISEMGAGRNVLGGLTDQGQINEIKGAIKERHGWDYYGLMGQPGETQTAAYRYSRGQGPLAVQSNAAGGIIKRAGLSWLAERGPEAVIPLSGGRRAMNLLSFANRALGMGGMGGSILHFTPNITIHGNATETEQRAMDSRLRDLATDFIEQFKRAQYQSRRLSYEGGY